jgi:peptidoglycan-N-acetylmuramic acid deacetylase
MNRDAVKKMKKQRAFAFLSCLCACVLLFAVCHIQAAAGGRSYSWYVRRNADHKQPTPDAHQATISKYGAYYVDRAHNEQAEDKVIYLTFDAGYENGNISKILDVLREKETPAAFFVLKNMLLKERALVERMERDGHLICNHTLNHKDTSCMTEEELTYEITGLAELYRKQNGREMASYYRPPEGKYSEESLRVAQKLG